MKSALLQSMLDSPMLPELIQQAREALAAEQRLRRKFREDIIPEHKWEFIQGEVIMHSPALLRHTLATKRLLRLLDAYVTSRELGLVLMEKALICFPRNDYEPDICFFGSAKAEALQPDTLLYPIPELIVEVLSPGTEKRDRGIKFQDYALHGVREYWIIDPLAETVELHRLQGEAYPGVERQSEGSLLSEVVPAFEIPLRAIFDEKANLETLRRFLG